jgi:CheY-like chemotaxis protein
VSQLLRRRTPARGVPEVTKIVTRVVTRTTDPVPGTETSPRVCAARRSRIRWHIVRILPLSMGTVLLVGKESTSEAPSETARRKPSLKGALERVGYHVVNAEDGAGALARLGPVPPDVIMLAGTVPDMELADLCAAVRHDPAAQKTPFVVVGHAAGRAGRAASRMGADFVFPPTVGPLEIAERLRRLI